MLFEYNHMGLEAMPDKTYNQTNEKKKKKTTFFLK